MYAMRKSHFSNGVAEKVMDGFFSNLLEGCEMHANLSWVSSAGLGVSLGLEAQKIRRGIPAEVILDQSLNLDTARERKVCG